MASLKKIKRLKELCIKYDLENWRILDGFSNTQLASKYNGIGPERFPDWLRTFLDYLHPSLEPVALIHDIEWELSDGTKESFTASNERFARNGEKVAKGEYGRFNLRRYVVIFDAKRFSKLCQKFGFQAWLAGAGNDGSVRSSNEQ